MLTALDAGADDFLAKPVDREQLLVRIRYAELALRRLERYAFLAETDPLTGMLNRRMFDELGGSQFRLSQSRQRPLTCVVLDIDLFKHINDTYGHATGDAALQSVANILRSHTRSSDYACRYGGDEFAVLLTDMTEQDSARWAERIRLAISDMGITVGRRHVPIRATLGVAQRKDSTASLRQLVDMADQALLTAKHSGRDRVAQFATLHDFDEICDAAGPDLRLRLSDVTAGEAMTTPVISLRQEEPIRQAADLFLRLRINSAPVVNEMNELVGIISEKDLLNITLMQNSWEMPIGDVMRTGVVCYDVDTPLYAIWEFLRRVAIRRVVIVKDRVPKGVISRGGLLRWVGNWGSVRATRQTDDIKAGRMHSLANLRKTAAAMSDSFAQLQDELESIEETPIPHVINTASALQQSIEDILAFSQTYYGFDPNAEDSPWRPKHPAPSIESPA
jgi:diguanylate cyclase (GGDEF)-like protein